VRSKKLLATIAVLTVALPSAAFAYHGTQVESTVVEGHTVFTDVLSESQIGFAAIAGSASRVSSIGGVLWSGDQSLFDPITGAARAQGSYVIGTETGDDAPFRHMDATYLESYRVTDPNGRGWVVDHYTYEICVVTEGEVDDPSTGDPVVPGTSHEVPCSDLPEEGESVDVPDPADDTTGDVQPPDDPGWEPENEGTDLDGDGHPDDLDGDGIPETGDKVDVTVKHVYLVQIGETTPDVCAGQGNYNFLLAIRMDGFDVTVPGTGPDGDTHDTAQVDLWFSDDRPPEPPVREFLFEDTIGSCDL
jgi:hypothetical protein